MFSKFLAEIDPGSVRGVNIYYLVIQEELQYDYTLGMINKFERCIYQVESCRRRPNNDAYLGKTSGNRAWC